MNPIEAKEKYLHDLSRRNRSQTTIDSYEHLIDFFIKWARCKGEIQIHDITQDDILEYCEFLQSIDEKKQSNNYRIDRIRAIKRLFLFLKNSSIILLNPCDVLPRLKEGDPLPKNLLTKEQLESILNFEPKTRYEYLQKAVIMTAFAGGLRSSELTNLSIYDVNLRESTVRVNEGKGKKDRIVPIGRACVDVLRHYLEVERPKLVKIRGVDYLFLSASKGDRFSPQNLQHVFRSLAKKLKIPHLTCHLMRHQSSVELVRNGMNLRYLQEYLSHEYLQTVQIYTRLSPNDVKKAHEKADPRKRIKIDNSEIKLRTKRNAVVFFEKKPSKRSKKN